MIFIFIYTQRENYSQLWHTDRVYAEQNVHMYKMPSNAEITPSQANKNECEGKNEGKLCLQLRSTKHPSSNGLQMISNCWAQFVRDSQVS